MNERSTLKEKKREQKEEEKHKRERETYPGTGPPFERSII
jgi:hypothetical protein